MLIVIGVYIVIAIIYIHYYIKKNKNINLGVIYTSYHPETYSFISEPSVFFKELSQNLYSIVIIIIVMLHGIIASGIFTIIILNHLVEDPLFYSPISFRGLNYPIQWIIAMSTTFLSIGHIAYLYHYLDVFFPYRAHLLPSRVQLNHKRLPFTSSKEITTIDTTKPWQIQSYNIDSHEGVYHTIYLISQNNQKLCIECPKIETKNNYPYWTTTTIPYTIQFWRSKGVTYIENLIKNNKT